MEVRIIWEELIHDLYNNGFIQFGDFTLASGVKSPYYIDMRLALSIPSILRKVVFLYRHEVYTCCKFDVLAGIEVGSIPIASILSYTMDVPMIYVRKRVKEHGLRKYVEGRLEEGSKVLVLEDVSTTGSSIIHAVEKIREAGGVVEDAIVFIDREQGAVENLEKHGVKLHPIYTVTQILDVLYEGGHIDRERYNMVVEYIESMR